MLTLEPVALPCSAPYRRIAISARTSLGKSAEPKARDHLIIPDCQVKPGEPTQHLAWIGQYIVDKAPDVVINLGDFWDLPSLSSYDKKGSKSMEGRRYVQDVIAGNDALELIRKPARDAKMKTEFVLLKGNHEHRLNRVIEEDPRLEGAIGPDDLHSPGWDVHDFLEPVWIDGVCYSHYFYQPLTGNPYTGTIENRLKQIGHSFTQGHTQLLLMGCRYVANRSQHGLVAGACYLGTENYKGPQGNSHWRGIVVKHAVRDGSYDLMTVSLDFLCDKYEGMPLDRFKKLNGIKD